MSKKNSQKLKVQIIKCECNHISQDDMMEIQAEAYYRALKKIEQEKSQFREQMHDKKKDKWYIVTYIRKYIYFGR